MIPPIEIDCGTHHSEDGRVIGIECIDGAAGRIGLVAAFVERYQRKAQADFVHRIARDLNLPLEGEFLDGRE